MNLIERFGVNVAIESSARRARQIASIALEFVTLSDLEKKTLEAYSAGYILQKEAFWGTQTKRSPSWKVTRFIPPIPQVVRWNELEDEVAVTCFKLGDEVVLDTEKYKHPQLRNLANLLSSEYLETQLKDTQIIKKNIQGAVESWRKKINP